jgi:F420-non-reducing hydrogenase iron-sulfur subunit
MSEPVFEPRIVGFFCNWCSYRAADLAGSARLKHAPNMRIIRVMCSGRVDIEFILKALAGGADGVLVAGCHPGECHYVEQNYKTIRRVAMLKHALKPLGIDPNRVRLQWASAAEGPQVAAAIDEFVDELRELGPLNWTGQWAGRGEECREAVDKIAAEHKEAMEVMP